MRRRRGTLKEKERRQRARARLSKCVRCGESRREVNPSKQLGVVVCLRCYLRGIEKEGKTTGIAGSATLRRTGT